MTTDLDNDIYKDDYEFINVQVAKFNEKMESKQEDYKSFTINGDTLIAPSIKMAQEGVFQMWQNYVRKHRKKLYQYCQSHDISRMIQLQLKQKSLEPQRQMREVTLQMCYIGYIQMEEFIKIDFPLAKGKQFSDFIHVMEAYNYEYKSVNYLKMIRGIYLIKPNLLELTYFKRFKQIPRHDFIPGVNLIQTAYRRYKYQQTELQKQVKILSNFNPDDLFELITKKIQSSQQSLKEIFEIFDINKDGNITFQEFVKAFGDSKIAFPVEVLQTVFDHFDTNRSGTIQYMEFLSKIQLKIVSNESLLNTQIKVEQYLQLLRNAIKRQFKTFEECFNQLQAQDRLKVKIEEFQTFVTKYTLRFSKIQLDSIFHYIDSKQKGYLNIEDFSLIFVDKPIQQMRIQIQEEKSQQQQAIKSMRSEIEDAKYMYHYIQAENMQGFIEQRDHMLADLLKTDQSQVKVNTSEIDQRVNVYKNQLLKLEIFIQQFSVKCLSKIKESGLTMKQFFSQFSLRFPEKFIDTKEFTLMLNVVLNDVMDPNLIMALFRVFSNTYIQRISYNKFLDLVKLGQIVSPIQLRMKYSYGSYIIKLRPQLIEDFQKQVLLSQDLKSLALRQCLEVLNKYGLNLELFEVQKLADDNIIIMKEKRYMVDYHRLLEMLFPERYVVEQVILQKYGYIIMELWTKVKKRYYLNKAAGKFSKKKVSKKLPKPIGAKKTLKEKVSEALPTQVKENPYDRMKQKEIYAFAKTITFECVEGAVLFAESILQTKEQQQQSQKKASIRDVIIVKQFQSLDLPNIENINFDSETSRLYLNDKQGVLYTQDISGNRMLQNVNLGTRIPFNKSFVVDLIMGNNRVFILKSNWQLQLFLLAQKSEQPEQSLDLREGAKNATESFKHLYFYENCIIVLSSERTHAYQISSVSLHIMKKFSLEHCVTYQANQISKALSKSVNELVTRTNEKYKLNLEMNLEQMEKIEKLRRDALDFQLLFKDTRVQKERLMQFMGQCSEIKQYFEEISDDEGYITKQQFDEMFRPDKKSTQSIWTAINMLRGPDIHLRQLFSTYETDHDYQNQQALDDMLKSLGLPLEQRRPFTDTYNNGIAYSQLNQLLNAPLSMDELQYKCKENHIDLKSLFKARDPFDVGLIGRTDFVAVLETLPFNITESEIDHIAEQQVYDSESGRIKYQETPQKQKQRGYSLAYIIDLDVIIYSVSFPRSNSIYVSNDNLLALLEGHFKTSKLLFVNQSGYLLSHSGDIILIHAVYKDLTLHYSVNPPWTLSSVAQIKCSSEIETLDYLSENQLIVAGCLEGVEIFDPVNIQQNKTKQLVRIKPGYYREQEQSYANKRLPRVDQLEMTGIKKLITGILQTPFKDEDHSVLLTFEFLIILRRLPMTHSTKNEMCNIQLCIIHRQSIDVPLTQIDMPIPVNIEHEIQKEIMTMLESAMRGKRASGVLGIEREMTKQTLRAHTYRNLIQLSKQLMFNSNGVQIQEQIIQEIVHASKYNGGLTLSFIYHLLRSTQCLNPHNISFYEFKHIVLYFQEYQVQVKTNAIEHNLQVLVREGQLDLAFEFQLNKPLKLQKDLVLTKAQFKKLLLKLKAYSNEFDLSEFVVNDFVSLKSLQERFKNDQLINKLRLIARPGQIITEIRKLGINKDFVQRLVKVDSNNDGLLTKRQFMEAVDKNHALFSEFFDLYSQQINNEFFIKITQVTAHLFSVEESLQQRKIFQTLAKVKNALVYRSLGLPYLFQQQELPFIDFIDAVMDLNVNDLTQQDAQELAQFLALDEQKVIPFSTFQHYINKLHAGDQFLLLTDYQDLLKLANDILQNKDYLRSKFKKAICQPWEVRAHLNQFDMESVDNYLIKVLKLKPITYDNLIDSVVVFINQIHFEQTAKESASSLANLLTAGPQQTTKYTSISKIGEIIKSRERTTIQKLYDQCLQFDQDRNLFIELPVFANILAYNLSVNEDLLVNFQFEWTQLTSESNINYQRFFMEFVKFTVDESNNAIVSTVNILLLQLGQAITKSTINLGFVLKRFYSYDGQGYMSWTQFAQFLQQIELNINAESMHELKLYFGEDVQHADIIRVHSMVQKNVQIVFDQNIWNIASEWIALQTLNKIGKWQQTKEPIRSVEFKRLFSQFDPSEQLQILRFACVGSRMTLDDAKQLSKDIRLNTADLSQLIVNAALFSDSITIAIRSKLKEKAQIVQHEAIVASEPSHDKLDVVAVKIRNAMKDLKTNLSEIVQNQCIEFSEEGLINRSQLRTILKAIPYKWTMKEMHVFYEAFPKPFKYSQLAQALGQQEELSIKIMLTKLFSGLYKIQSTLPQLFQSLGKPSSSNLEVQSVLAIHMSKYEAKLLYHQVFRNSEQLTEKEFLEKLKDQNFNDLQLLQRSGIQKMNEQVIAVLHEFESMKQSELTLAQIQVTFMRMGVYISNQAIYSLLNNYLFQTTGKNPLYEAKIQKYKIKEFLDWLIKQPNEYKSQIKAVHDRLVEQNLGIFEFFAVCDIQRNQSITEQELKYGFLQVQLPQFDMWDELEKVQTQVPFDNFLLRFLEVGSISMTEADLSVELLQSAIRKLGNISESFQKISEDGVITYKSLKLAHQKYKLQLTEQNVQDIYLYLRKQHPIFGYREFAQVMQQNRQVEMIHQAFQSITNFKQRDFPDECTLEQLKQVLSKKGIKSQEINIIVNSFENTNVTSKQIIQKIADYSNISSLKESLSHEKIIVFCHAIVKALKGQVNQLTKVYTQYSIGSVNNITFENLYAFLNYLEVPVNTELLKRIYQQLDTESKKSIKSSELESYLRRSLSQVRVKTLDHTKKQEVNEILRKGIKNILNSYRAKAIKVSSYIDLINLTEFLQNFVILSEAQINLLIEAIQDQCQVQKITWADFALYMLEDNEIKANVYFKECLEVFQTVIKRLNIRAQIAIKYFGSGKISIHDFVNMMLSMGYSQSKLKLNLRLVHSVFNAHGGDEMSDLEFLMMMTEQEQTQLSAPVLELLVQLFKRVLKLNLDKTRLFSILNVNKSGWLSKEELLSALLQIDPTLNLIQIRAVSDHLTQTETLINVAQLVKLVFIGGSLNDNSLEINAFLIKHYTPDLAFELIQMEQLGPNTDGLVQQITIAQQDFFRMIPKHKEQDIALIARSFGLRVNQLDLEAIYEAIYLISLEQDNVKINTKVEEVQSETLEQSVVLKILDQPVQNKSNLEIFEHEIIEHICAVINQNQMSLLKSVFSEKGHISAQQFQVILANIGVPLTALQTRSLIKLIDRKSDGTILQYSELISQIELQGYTILTDTVNKVSVQNQLLQKFCSLDLGDTNYPDQMTVQDFYRLVSLEGTRIVFNKREFQTLANLFTQNGLIQKSLLQQILATQKMNFVDHNIIQKQQLKNIFYIFNGFEIVLTFIRSLREIYNTHVETFKTSESKYARQLQSLVNALYVKISRINQYINNDIQLIQSAVFNTLNQYFTSMHIQLYLQLKSERNRMHQMQLQISGVFIGAIPESQLVPLSIPLIEGRGMYEMTCRLSATNEKVVVTVWTVALLQSVCYDGQLLRLHVMESVRLQSVLKNACKMCGIVEKKTAMGVELQSVHLSEGVSMREVCSRMGGLLKIPELVLSGQMVLVAKHWLKGIIEVIFEINSYGYCMPLLRSEIIYFTNSTVKIADVQAVQSTSLGRCCSGIDVKTLLALYQTDHNALSLAPELQTKRLQEITDAVDSWQFGLLIFELLFGNRPQSVSSQSIEPSDFHSGDLLQKEIFENLASQLSDIISEQPSTLTQQMQLQLTQKSLGAYLQKLFTTQNTDPHMLQELSLIIDLMCACLQFEPSARPTISAIQRSALLQTDTLNAAAIAQPLLSYSNPRIGYHAKIYYPARQIALDIIKNISVDVNYVIQLIQNFEATLQNSIADTHRLDLITYIFHSRILDILNFIVLHINHQQDNLQLVVAFAQIFVQFQKHLVSYDHPASSHVEAILLVLIKFTLGEPYQLLSDKLFTEPCPGFFQIKQDELDIHFKKVIQQPFSLWTPLIYKIAGPIYKDMISDSGVGSGTMVAVRNYIQLCTEKKISPFETNTFSLHQVPMKYNTIIRTAEYYNEVISLSDAQLHIANYINGTHSKSSLKISLNYVNSLVKCNKISKLQVLGDSKCLYQLVSLLSDSEYRATVIGMLFHISGAFKNEVPQSLKIEHQGVGMVQQYQQNNAVHLLRNLSIICHVLNHSKNRLSNERFLSMQPTEHNQSEQDRVQKITLQISKTLFALPNVYQGLFIVLKFEPKISYAIISNLLQWPDVGKYSLAGVTQQLLVEVFQPIVLQAEHKKSPLFNDAICLYREIETMALPNTIELIHKSKVRHLLASHNLQVPETSSSEKFAKLMKEYLAQWMSQREQTMQNIREQIQYTINGRPLKVQPNQLFLKIRQSLKQIQAYVMYVSKEVLLENSVERAFIRQTMLLIIPLFQDLLTFGQLHQECNDLLHALSEFLLSVTLISPLLVFDIQEQLMLQNSLKWLKETVDSIYEYHIEWDRVNEARRQYMQEIKQKKQEEEENNQQYLEQLKQSQMMKESKISKNVSFQQSKMTIAQSRIEESHVIVKQEPLTASAPKKLLKSKLPESQQIKKKDARLQESQISIPEKLESLALQIELRPYSSNKLIQCALNLLKILTAVVDSNIQQYLQILTIMRFGEWFTNLTFKMWIIFDRVIASSIEQSLIIKNQVDESMVRTSLFEAIAKCSSLQLQDQLINGGYIKGIFAYLLANQKSFELQKIVKSHSYVPFIHWMPYRHEALVYFTTIIWERRNCTNFYNEMMIEVHARNTLQEESLHLSSKIDPKSKHLNSTILFTRVYMLCLLISAQDSGLIFLMKQLLINQKLLQLFQANEDFRQLFQGIYQYLVNEEIAI